MASVSRLVASGDFFSVSMTFDDVTGAISQIAWTVTAGTLVVVVQRTGQPDITLTKTTSGSQNVPAGYNLTQGPKGDWRWTGPLSYSISWN